MKKKVLYIITKSNWGGAQRYVYDLATTIPKGDFTSTVAAGGAGLLKERLIEQKIPFITLQSLGRDIHIFNDFKVFFELISLLKQEKPDIIHLNSSKIGLLGALAARIHNLTHTTIHIIFTGHGWAHTEDRPSWQRCALALLHWFTIVLSHTTIAVSETSKSEVSSMPGIAHKIKVVHNGVGVTDTYSTQEAQHIIEELSGTTFSPEEVIIGTIAELHTNKGLSYLIDAFAAIEQKTASQLIIIGDGEEKESLQKQIQKKDLTHTVHSISRAGDAQKLLSGFDIFVLPSIKEGFPYVVLEAGAAGLPIIASRVGGIPEVISDGHNGILCTPKSSKELSEAFLSLIHDTKKREMYGHAIQETVTKKFSLEIMTQHTIRLYADS